MKRLSSLILVAVLALFTANSAIAQQREKRTSNPEERAKQMTEKMKAEIQLDEAQYAKVYALNLKHIQQMQEARKTSNVQQNDRRETFRAMQKTREEELAKVLSSDQMKKFKEQQKANAEKMREGRKNRGQ